CHNGGWDSGQSGQEAIKRASKEGSKEVSGSRSARRKSHARQRWNTNLYTSSG
ncbi:Hypothetical predicted protein, partial [Xyrichtys novacula]